MRILGIDPGLNFTGWGVIDFTKQTPTYIACDIITSSSRLPISQRLHNIYNTLKTVMSEFSPEVVAIEETFVNKDPKGALKLGYARGIALMVPTIFNLQIHEYAPNTVKKTVAGNGHASKDQIKAMIKILMPNIKEIKDDAIDALSIALCHAYSSNNFLQK